MKRRILALILVVVMLALSLVGCGYSYSKDDMAQYATFDKAAFEASLSKLEIEDGDFTDNEDTRAQKVIDYIQELLVKGVDTEAKVTEGKVGGNDKFYYCYYITATVGDSEVTLVTANMKEASALSVQFGLTDTEGLSKLVETAFTGVDLKDIVYKTSTTGKAATGKKAFISYTVEYTETIDGTEKVQKFSYDNELVTLGDKTHPVAEKLVDSNVASSIDEFTVDGKKYTGAKVNWVVDAGKETIIKDTTYTESKKLKDANGTEHELKDVELTYHVYPVYFLEVDELNATSIVKTLLTALITETTDENGDAKKEYALPSIEANAELAKAVDDLRKALDEATKAVTDAEKARDEAQKALSTAEGAVKEGETPTEAQQQTIDAAKDALNGNAEKNIKGAIPTLVEKQEAEKTAQANFDAKIAELVAAVGEDKIVTEYKEDVYDTLLESYNSEIKMSLAKAVWEKIQQFCAATLDNLPKGAIQNAYDRMMEQYEYTFYEGTYNSETSQSNYAAYKGEFRSFLADKLGADSFENAKHELWADAKDYVLPVVKVYAAAAAYELTVTKDEIKAAMEDTTKNYSYYEFYNGEENVEIAIQFDKLMDSILEYEENETTGAFDYKKLSYTIKED